MEIKFRRKDIVKAIHRIDPECGKLVEKLNFPELSRDERSNLDMKLSNRENDLHPIYHQVAVEFADLHDTAGRMAEKEVITVCVIPCNNSHTHYRIYVWFQ